MFPHLQDLADDLSSELSGNFRSVVLGLLMLPTVYDAYELKTAMKVRLHYSVAFFFPFKYQTTKASNGQAKSDQIFVLVQ